MDFNEIITFEGGLNTDDTPQSMPKGDYRDLSYCRIGYNSGNAYSVVTSQGTLLIENTEITSVDKILGATTWQKTNSIVYFVFKDDGEHQIWVYDISAQTHTLAVEGGELNFSPDWPIYHANIIDDILKWTDGRWDPQMYGPDGERLFNPPYQINLAKALESPSPNGFYTVVDLQTIDAIKWPMDPPIVSYFTDPTRQDNKLRNKLFKFIVQPIYENGEVGAWSMYSDLPLPQQSELVSGTNWLYPNNSNGIKIQFYTGPKIIRKFNIAVQQFDKDNFGAEPPFGIFLQLDKEQDSILDNELYFVDFYGDAALAPAIDFFKNYDRLPITADCQEYLPTSQLTYVNFREGYNKPSAEYELLNVNVGYDLNEINWNPNAVVTMEFIVNFPSFTKYLNYINFPILSLESEVAQFFKFAAGSTFSMTVKNYGTFVYTITESNIQNALQESTIILQNLYIMQLIGDEFSNQFGLPLGTAGNLILPSGTTNRWGYYWTSGTFSVQQDDPVPGFSINTIFSSIPAINTNAAPSLKSGATHSFGIVYGDRAYRDSTVYTVDSMDLFVPWFFDINRDGLNEINNPFTITPNFTINHIPPVWATKYWIVAKPATEVLDFSQYTTNNIDAPYTSHVSSIVLDSATQNRYKIVLDNYYLTQNKGAVIRHQIRVGDKIRFIRRRASGYFNNASFIPYLEYLELDVVDYVESDASNGNRQVVYTNLFDTSLIDITDLAGVNNQLFGSLIEIYTPRPSVDDTGNIFISPWNDISQAIDIKNPHTNDRSHASPPKAYLQVGNVNPYPSSVYIYVYGDSSGLAFTYQDITIYYDDGTTETQIGAYISSANYYQNYNTTLFVFSTVSADSSMSYITIDNQSQVVTDLTSTSPASFGLNYGDVYVRQRNYLTGLTGSDAIAYYYIEDPNYSDYWQSDVHSTGRLRIEDQNAKMANRQATAIHSDSFIAGTQINGLSSFALDNQNIQDLNAVYGPVVRAFMSGREGKTLKCLQPKKENSIYIQYYPNEVGSDSTVRVSNRTFASWFDNKSLLGCTNPGASVVLPNGAAMYFDNNTGVFVYSGGNGQIQVSEIDPDTRSDYKFRTKTKQLAKTYNENTNPVVRTYVNESVGEAGFAFEFIDPNTDDSYYDHVVFDYVNMRWRSTYDYNFRQYCNFGQTLVGWGVDNQMYLHNQPNQWTFHGDQFLQQVSFVSNENPLLLKRYQDIALVSDKPFTITAQSEPNQSYPLGMNTRMPKEIINIYEGYGKVYYRKNLYDSRFFNANNISDSNLLNWELDNNQSNLLNQNITIIQQDGDVFTGKVIFAIYNPSTNKTVVVLLSDFGVISPNSTGIAGTWYYSDQAYLNGEDVRANALTHTLIYDPSILNQGSVLFSVGIKGVLS